MTASDVWADLRERQIAWAEAHPDAPIGGVASTPASASGTAYRPCYHPRSCLRCDRIGFACGAHAVGEVGHEGCSGR